MAKGKKYYVVWEGHTTGIFDSWTACQLQIKGYPGAKYKSFKTLAAAQAAFDQSYTDVVDLFGNKKPKANLSTLSEAERKKIVWESISVDAACSGNPGIMEYQGVHTQDGSQLFHQKFQVGTNNIGEFLALVHALAYLKNTGSTLPIYTDSKIALKWVAQKKCNTKLKNSGATKKLYGLIQRAEHWLKEHSYDNKILKWDTANWGEIPADFGRK